MAPRADEGPHGDAKRERPVRMRALGFACAAIAAAGGF
jgi:hypothetical protein